MREDIVTSSLIGQAHAQNDPYWTSYNVTKLYLFDIL